MRVNFQAYTLRPQNRLFDQNFKAASLSNRQNKIDTDTLNFKGLSKKDKRSIYSSLAIALICSAAGACLSVYSAFTQPQTQPAAIEEPGEVQTPDISENIVIDTRSDEEKFEEAKEALVQAISGYETCATHWSLYGSETSLNILKDKEDNPDYSDFLNTYKNLITFNKDTFPGIDPKDAHNIGDDIKDTEKMLDLIRSTVFSALYTHSDEGGYSFSSLTALNDVSRSEWQSIMNLLNGIIYSKEASGETKQAAQIYKDEIIKAENKSWVRPSGFYKAETLEQEIDNNDALRAYLIENVDSIKEAAKELAELRAAFMFSETTDGMSEEYKEHEELYLEACKNKDYEAQKEIRNKQSEAYEDHYIGVSFPAYQAYYEAYNAKIVTPLETIWPDLKFADVSIEFLDMVDTVVNAETRLKDEMGITSGFDTTNEIPFP